MTIGSVNPSSGEAVSDHCDSHELLTSQYVAIDSRLNGKYGKRYALGDSYLIRDSQSLRTQLLDGRSPTELLNYLIENVPWQAGFYVAFERRFEVPRLQAWYATNGIHYRHTNNLLTTLPWSPVLTRLRQRIQLITGVEFNAVLLTYYRNGHDNVGWHSDDELELGPDPVIASLSLGETRIFQIRHKLLNEVANIRLNNGDLLLMGAGFQTHWQHRIDVEPSVSNPRINLTFRQVKP